MSHKDWTHSNKQRYYCMQYVKGAFSKISAAYVQIPNCSISFSISLAFSSQLFCYLWSHTTYVVTYIATEAYFSYYDE